MDYKDLREKGVYLDNAATSFPKPKCVPESISNYIINNGTSSARGGYSRAIEADYMVYETRKWIGELFNHRKPSDVVFTSGVTESLNGIMMGILAEGDHVVTSSIEHNSVWRCLKYLERDRNIEISVVKTSPEGIIYPEYVQDAIQDNTKLMIINHASNVIGTIQPIKEIGSIAREHNIPFLVDAAQTAGVLPIDMKDSNIDILAFTGHKGLLGPTGIGGFVINWDGEINEWKAGGTGGNSADPYMPDIYPNKYEAGTLNMVGIAGLHASVRYILDIGVEKIYRKEKNLTEYTLERLKCIPEVIVYGTKDSDNMVGVISFNVKKIASSKIGFILDKKYHIMVRTGIHCSPLLHKIIHTEDSGTVRIGIGYMTTREEIDYLIEALQEIISEQVLNE